MRIQVSHDLRRQEAIWRINRAIDDPLKEKLPGGVRIKMIERDWVGGVLKLGAIIRRGLTSVHMKGQILCSDGALGISLEVPPFVRVLVTDPRTAGGDPCATGVR